MDDEAHIRFVDPHAKRIGGHHHLPSVIDKIFLVLPPLLIRQPGVIAGDRDPFLAELVTDLVHFFAGQTVDDPAGPRHLYIFFMYEREQGMVFIRWFFHGEE